MSRHVSGLLLLCVLLSFSIPSVATAGAGKIVGDKVNLSVMFTYREEDPDSWKPLFERGSRLLYNATNGQLQLGTIRLYDAGVNKREADVWILDDRSGSFANLLALGGAGHVYLSQTHKSVVGPALGQFGLVHEFGHYGFGLYDEYKAAPPSGGLGPDWPGEQWLLPEPNQFCTTELDPTACLMDGGSMVIPNNRRTEFCTDADGGLGTAHNTGSYINGQWYVNAQETLNHESCWETIARTVRLVPPTTVDTEDPPGLEPISWQVVPSIDRLSILIDRSISMFQRSDRIDLAKDVSSSLVQLLHERKTINIQGEPVTIPGERTGVVAFAFDPLVISPMREILDSGTKDSIDVLIDRIDRTTGPCIYETDMESGLRSSLQQLSGAGSQLACSQSIILLSDGSNNVGADPAGLIRELKEHEVRVFSIAVGGDPNVDLMRTLADSTGGSFFRAALPEDVPGVAVSLNDALRATGAMEAFEDSTNGWDVHIPYVVDLFAEEFTATLQWDVGVLDMNLVSPSGDLITVESAEWRQDVEAERIGDLLYIRVSNPEAGEWTANIHPLDVPSMIHFTLRVDDENRTITVNPSTDQQLYDVPTPIHLRVDVVADVPVAGAAVTARVERPGGRPDMILLFDDGRAEHGDQWANDGCYNTIYRGFTADGTYTFHVRVVNEDGSGPSVDLPFIEDGPGPPPTVPPFTREASVSAEVQGIVPRIFSIQSMDPLTVDVHERDGFETAYLELPSPYRVEDVDLRSVRLNGVVRAVPGQAVVGDHDGNGVPDLALQFGKAEVIDALPDGIMTPVRLTAQLTCGEPVQGDATIAIIEPRGDGAVEIPDGTLPIGRRITIRWPAAEGSPITYGGYLSPDGQTNWTQIFGGVEGTSVDWVVTGGEASTARIVVQAETPEGVAAQWMSRAFAMEGIASGADGPPARTVFLGASPNPMTASTTLRFSLARDEAALLEIYDVSGRLVRRLVSGTQTAGVHEVLWNGTDTAGRNVPSGVFMYVFRAGSVRASGRMMLIQ